MINLAKKIISITLSIWLKEGEINVKKSTNEFSSVIKENRSND